MSKFIDNIKAKFTGRERMASSPVMTMTADRAISDNAYFSNPVPILREYTISVGYHQKVYCRPSELDRVMDTYIRALKREVYGEFLDRVSKIEIAVYEDDRDAALAHLRDLLVEVNA
jgi:hypothetical protein